MSSKKPFDHIEEKIKEAAGNYQPAFDEMAWKAMEAKLDNDRKKPRPLLWWFVLPLLMAGSWGIYYKFNNASNLNKKLVAESIAGNTSAKSENKNVVNETENTNENDVVHPAVGENTTKENKGNGHGNKMIDAVKKGNATDDNKTTSVAPPLASLVKANKIPLRKKGRVTVNNSAGDIATIDNGKIPEGAKETRGEEAGKAIIAENNDVENNKETTVTEPKNQVAALEGTKEKKQTVVKDKDSSKAGQQAAAPKKGKEKSKKSKGFYVQASSGMDAGSTKLFSYKSSTTTAKYGIGVGYQFNKRLSVQTGFYSNMKKYAAAPIEYKVKPGSPMADYPYPIEGIKATCLVYEIPLAVKYDFISKPSFIVYATAGVSSYIMQKEKYECFYTYYNTVYENAWLYKGNKHLFSTAVFSVGIEKKLFSRFSLLAEPSISVPLTGVGDGEMKIYSSALQLGLKYYLFKKR